MSLLAEGLQPVVAPGLFRANSSVATTRISDALISRGTAYTVSFLPDKKIRSDFWDANVVGGVMAADINRLCVSSYQSATEAAAGLSQKFAAPWGLIKIYYAAFYAGHALVRMLGGGCCWLEGEHTSQICLTAAAAGNAPTFNVDPGNYCCEVELGGTAWQWKKLSGGKGTHETFWSYFEAKLRIAAAGILTGPMPAAESQKAYAKLLELLDLSAVRRSSHWLSRIRNEVQYRFEHGAWHPADLTQADRTALSAWASQWEEDPLNISFGPAARLGEVGEFVVACTFVVALCKVVAQRISERNPSYAARSSRLSPANFLALRAAA